MPGAKEPGMAASSSPIQAPTPPLLGGEPTLARIGLMHPVLILAVLVQVVCLAALSRDIYRRGVPLMARANPVAPLDVDTYTLGIIGALEQEPDLEVSPRQAGRLLRDLAFIRAGLYHFPGARAKAIETYEKTLTARQVRYIRLVAWTSRERVLDTDAIARKVELLLRSRAQEAR